MNNDKVISIMEVRIKDANGYVDADWTIEDGVMVVSPKKVFEPKDGDIVSVKDGSHVFINKEYSGHQHGYAYIGWNFDNDMMFYEGDWNYSRYATEEEKKKLFDKLADEGWEWNSEKKELVKIKWKPERDDWHYRPMLNTGRMVSHQTRWLNDIIDNSYYDKGWCFKTEAECQAFCDRLNEAIIQVKP